MVRTQLEARGISDPKILEAMSRLPRHRFVPGSGGSEAYGDFPWLIGRGQTISQPYMVALMTEELRLRGGEKVLEVGTGSGYQTALLAELAAEVYSMELLPVLQERARLLLGELGYRGILFRAGDGWYGWPEVAPFDPTPGGRSGARGAGGPDRTAGRQRRPGGAGGQFPAVPGAGHDPPGRKPPGKTGRHRVPFVPLVHETPSPGG